MGNMPAKRDNPVFVLSVACLLAASPVVARAATITALYSFTGGKDGGNPMGPLTADAQGNLYGVTAQGGAGKEGLIYRLSPPAQPGSAWTETVLYDFTTVMSGVDPIPPLVLGLHGELYGVTFDGGNCFYYCGLAFRLSPGANAQARWTYSVLYRFPGAKVGTGGAPNGALLADGSGGYLGTTQYGGAINNPGGTVFRVTPPAKPGIAWTETVLHSFGNLPDGNQPVGAVVADAHGNLYGAASSGGDGHCTDGERHVIGCGTIFQLSPKGATWVEQAIYQFTPNEYYDPEGPVTFGPDGALYGAALYDIFRLTPQANPKLPWTKQVIYEFRNGSSGTIPWSGLVFDAAGNIYGTTDSSGMNGFSTVFKLSPPPAGATAWTLTTLAKFGHGLGGQEPTGGVILGAGGVIYGVLYCRDDVNSRGSVFAITP